MAIHESKGLAYLKMHRPDRALAEYDLALSQAPNQAFSRYGRGLALAMKGRQAEAKADQSAAIAIDPAIKQTFAGYGVKACAANCS